MGFFFKKDDYSNQINQELYKRNVELAFHNKMLNLLRQLYRITLSNLGAKDVALQMVTELQENLAARRVQIRLLNKEKNVLETLACACAIDDNKHNHTLCIAPIEYRADSIAGKILSSHQQIGVHSLGELWGQKDNADYKNLQKELGMVEMVAYPLVLGEELEGLFFIGFDRGLADLSTYEQETIDNVAKLVSIAVDKAILYDRLNEVNKQLEKQNLQLKEIDQQKTDFLSIASHQLRTPLTVINGYIELIKDGGYGKITSETEKILDNMDSSNGHLLKLVDEFLDITRLDQGRTKYAFKPIDLVDMVDGVVKEQSNRAKQKGLKLVWAKPKTHIKADVDDEKIRHVIYNFVDNAIKYCPKGSVTVSIEKDGDDVVFRVKDTGIGFSKEDEANFFQKFYRGENVKTIDVGGTGLGLYVCRKFIEAHNGKIWAKSPGLGKGGEFGFSIPLKQSISNKY